MNPHEIFDSIMAKSLEHGIDFNFLYPAVLSIAESVSCNDDRIFRAYFDRESDRLAIMPAATKPASEGEVNVVNKNLFFIKGISFYLPTGTQVTELHIDLYEKLLRTAADMKIRFGLLSGSNELHTIIRNLCSDIIQTLHDRRVILN